MQRRPVVIEVALNGSTTKAQNPTVPRSSAELVADALACIEAGATIVHHHTDDPVFGAAGGVHAVEPYAEVWTELRAQCPGIVLYPTMASGGSGTTIESRWGHVAALGQLGLTEMGLVDPGSLSLGSLTPDGLPASVELVYTNTFADTRYMLQRCAELALAPSLSIFDPSFLRVVLAVHEAGRLPAGAMVKLYFGGRALFGLPPTEPSLDAYVAMLDGSGLPWSVAVLGGDVVGCGLARAAIERGGHVRVGLEDFFGDRRPSNVDLVNELVAEIDATGARVASLADTRGLLGLS